MLTNNLLAFILTLTASILWLALIEFSVKKGWIPGTLSRKIIHIGTGPIFVICWLIFNNTSSARWYAAVIPLLITIHFFLVGMGISKDQNAVKAMSRSQDRKELLFGPTFYGLIFVVLTIVYWYDSPIGIIALMVLSGGDGLADVFGRSFGTTKLPWTNDKTWMGTLGMFVGAWAFSVGISALYTSVGIFPNPLYSYLLPITLITLIATIVESLPIKNLDNITVAVSAVLAGYLFL